MIIPFPPPDLDLLFPTSILGSPFKVFGQQLSVVVKLVAGPIVDLDGDLLVLGVGSEEVGAIMFRPL